MRRTLRILTITGLLVLTMASTAVAGGWAVTTFDEVASELQAGTTYPLGYTILAHGRTPVDGETTSVRFHGPDGETLTFLGEPDGKGHYTAEVLIPETGEWRWEVTQGMYAVQELGTMTVGAPPGIAVTGPSGLLTMLQIAVPIATVLAILVLTAQVVSLIHINKQSAARDVA